MEHFRARIFKSVFFFLARFTFFTRPLNAVSSSQSSATYPSLHASPTVPVAMHVIKRDGR
jgi:hypothetical protein